MEWTISSFKNICFSAVPSGQFGTLTLELTESSLEVLLSYPDISQLVTIQPLSVNGCITLSRSPIAKWLVLVPGLSEEGWDEATEVCFQDIISTADSLIQFKFIHMPQPDRLAWGLGLQPLVPVVDLGVQTLSTYFGFVHCCLIIGGICFPS